ncbi:hypothetical protein U9M48_008033 [Paspalum notatum var. saurae]|uniref:Uncharacterized protein n=1 Tax=Paspalum notatum var. saurae TaxID=547442 RepID=A0AAQ3SNA3_PASNO
MAGQRRREAARVWWWLVVEDEMGNDGGRRRWGTGHKRRRRRRRRGAVRWWAAGVGRARPPARGEMTGCPAGESIASPTAAAAWAVGGAGRGGAVVLLRGLCRVPAPRRRMAAGRSGHANRSDQPLLRSIIRSFPRAAKGALWIGHWCGSRLQSHTHGVSLSVVGPRRARVTGQVTDISAMRVDRL